MVHRSLSSHEIASKTHPVSDVHVSDVQRLPSVHTPSVGVFPHPVGSSQKSRVQAIPSLQSISSNTQSPSHRCNHPAYKPVHRNRVFLGWHLPTRVTAIRGASESSSHSRRVCKRRCPNHMSLPCTHLHHRSSTEFPYNRRPDCRYLQCEIIVVAIHRDRLHQHPHRKSPLCRRLHHRRRLPAP